MKILLDENLPRRLKADFGADFEVYTVRDMNWLGKKNGELLGLIVFNGFDIFITAVSYTHLTLPTKRIV